MKRLRQEKLLELISKYEIDTQDELIERLRESGFEVTQATVSRDIKEMHIVKHPASSGEYKYCLPTQSHEENSGKYMSILIGVNDVSHELTMNCGVSPKKFRMIFEMLIDEIKESLPEIKIIIIEPFVLKGTATEKLWIEFNSEVRKMAEISKQIAEKYDFDFVPLQNRFDELSADGNTGYWTADGIHPTLEGHQIIKEELQKVIEKYI